VNQLLVIFFYPNAAKIYKKGYWDVKVGENHLRAAECNSFFKSIDYYDSLMEKWNFPSVRLNYYSGWIVYINFVGLVVMLETYKGCLQQIQQLIMLLRAMKLAVVTRKTRLHLNCNNVGIIRK
jgi:hypothetical protein